MSMDLSLFTKVDIQSSASTRSKSIIRATKKGYNFSISAKTSIESGLKPEDRVDLYRMGQTYALKKSNVGALTLKRCGSGPSLRISSMSLWLNTSPHENDVTVYEAWVEEGVIFFKEEK